MLTMPVVVTNNINARPERKRAPIHRCATVEQRIHCETQYFCKHAPISRPKMTRQKTRKFTRAFAKILRFAKDSAGISDFSVLKGCKGGMDAIVIVCSRNTNIIMVWAWMLWLSFALGTRALPGFGHGCAVVCSRNTNVIMVWAWSCYLWYAFGTRTFLWFGRGCAIVSMLSEPPMPLFIVCSVCSRNTNIITVWAWMRDSMLSEHKRHYGLGMDALFIVCSWNTNAIVVWAWMRLSSYALGTRTLSWFGHGCTSNRMLAEHERSYGLGMVALFMVCFRNTNVIMVWAWMR